MGGRGVRQLEVKIAANFDILNIAHAGPIYCG
jgi:hypothetical protein